MLLPGRAATAVSAGVTALFTSAAGPGTVKVTSALRPFAETSAWPPGLSGDLIPVAAPGSLGQRGRHLADGLAHRGIGRERLPRYAFLDKHGLGRRGCHAEALQGLLGLPGLAEVVLLAGWGNRAAAR